MADFFVVSRRVARDDDVRLHAENAIGENEGDATSVCLVRKSRGLHRWPTKKAVGTCRRQIYFRRLRMRKHQHEIFVHVVAAKRAFFKRMSTQSCTILRFVSLVRRLVFVLLSYERNFAHDDAPVGEIAQCDCS